uniref:Uncharacterized protein n=1 Tax=Rhodosorus marinus TaxID=101924 RepID=A0A7S2ZHP9_9RHOD|mmetsp:Transcript_20012/g.80145  ORF Transcript_20012/g.80145 Transcript_20012/m.80145 type:complete len:186 (+) Transcript_20012:180-737(+)
MTSNKARPLKVKWRPKAGDDHSSSQEGGFSRLENYRLPGEKHPDFDEELGVYSVRKDGVFLVAVEVKDRTNTKKRKRSDKNKVEGLVLSVETVGDEDEFHDLGSSGSGSLYHFSRGSKLSLMSTEPIKEKLTVRIETVQRKKKILEAGDSIDRKKRKKTKKSKDNEHESADDEEWQKGFDSDSDV